MSAQLKRWVIGSAGALIVSAGAAFAQSPTSQPLNQQQQPALQPSQRTTQGQAQTQAQAHKVEPLPDQAKAKVISDTRKLAADFEKAWNDHDAKALSQLFTREGAIATAMGQSAVGREEVQKLFTEMHAGHMKDTQLSVKIDSVRELRPDMVIIDATNTLTSGTATQGRAAGAPEEAYSVLIAQRERGKWLLREMRVVPVPQQQPGVGGAGQSPHDAPADGQTDTGGSGEAMPPADAGTQELPRDHVPE